MDRKWRALLPRALFLGVLLCAVLGAAPQPAAALSLNPLDYYAYDYYIVLSHTEVEPGETFSVTAGATVRCTRDLPFGISEGVVRFKVLARHATSGSEVVLLDSYEVRVSDVPDWKGDEYSTTETSSMSFPAGAEPGNYAITARLEHLSLDGVNLTSMVPGSARNVALGSIACTLPDAPPTPEPTPQPGVLLVSVLGHEFRPEVDDDGVLQDALNASQIEGLLSLSMEAGTRCVDTSGDALAYLSAARDPSPEPYDAGAVVSAFSLRPNGARFQPSLRIGISYETEELPPGCDEDELAIGYYDRAAGGWQTVPSVVEKDLGRVYADVQHFTTFGLLAPTSTPGPARFSVRSLDLSPVQVAPFGRVNVTVVVANTGDTAGSYPLVVRVGGQQEHSESIELQPRQSRTVRLTVVRSLPGVYEVTADNLSESFAVVESGSTPPTGGTSNPGPTTTQSGEPTSPDGAGRDGMHPVYIVLLALLGITFITLVVLVLSGAL